MPSFFPKQAGLKKKAQGFSLVAAIFLLVIIAGLGAFMLSVYSVQRATSNQDVLGTRAYHAAKAGLEWASFQILDPENAIAITAPATCAAATGSPVFGGALQGFVVNVTCNLTETREGSNVIRLYQITSTAFWPPAPGVGTVPGPDYVERRIYTSLSTCRIGVGAVAPC